MVADASDLKKFKPLLHNHYGGGGGTDTYHFLNNNSSKVTNSMLNVGKICKIKIRRTWRKKTKSELDLEQDVVEHFTLKK